MVFTGAAIICSLAILRWRKPISFEVNQILHISRSFTEGFIFFFSHSLQYQFNWNVRDAEAEKNGLFFEQTEGKNEETPDRTEGEYKVSENDETVFCNYGYCDYVLFMNSINGIILNVTYAVFRCCLKMEGSWPLVIT